MHFFEFDRHDCVGIVEVICILLTWVMCGLQAADSYQAPGGAITMVNKFGQKYHCEFPPKVSLTPLLSFCL